jgi:hypothetical protein
MKKNSLFVIAFLLIFSTHFFTSIAEAENEIPKKKVVCNFEILLYMKMLPEKINEKRCEVEFFSEAQKRAENYTFNLPDNDRERSVRVAKNVCSIMRENRENLPYLWQQVKNNFLNQGLPHQKERRTMQIASGIRTATYWFCPEQIESVLKIQLEDGIRF